MSESPPPPRLSQYLHILSEYRLLVCKGCQHAVWPQELARHFRGAHHKLRKSDITELVAAALVVPDILKSHHELTIPVRVPKPLPHLTLHQDGVACTVDRSACRFICRTVKGIKAHLKSTHEHTLSSRKGRPSHARAAEQALDGHGSWKSVHCQRFFPSRHGSIYFEVEASRPGASPDAVVVNLPSRTVAWQAITQSLNETYDKAAKDEQQIITVGLSNEPNPWLERARWPQYLTGLDRDMLVSLVATPDPVSEAALTRLWQAMGTMLRHCQETLDTRVGIYVRLEAVRSEPHQARYRPLRPYQSRKSLDQACKSWQQILMIFARTQSDPDSSLKYKFTSVQKKAWHQVTRLINLDDPSLDHDGDDGRSESDEASQLSAPSAVLDGLPAACLRFAISLLDHQTTRNEYKSPLICALAVLAVKPLGWVDIGGYTSILSALIKTSRTMVIQRGLELAAAESDDLSSSSGNSSSGSGSEAGESTPAAAVEKRRAGCLGHVTTQMDAFMVRGTACPLHWMLDLRSYGMKIAWNSTTAGYVDWSGDQITYKAVQFTMSEFRGLIHGLVNATQQLLFLKLLLLKPTQHPPRIVWSNLVDNASDASIGWSFLNDDRNRVFGEKTWLLDRVGHDPSLLNQFFTSILTKRWNHDAVKRYMTHVIEFRGKLLLLMHLTGGQPARAPELLGLRHRNTSQGQHRNIFVEDGLMVFVTRYHKGYSTSSHVKIIHRYLPREVGRLLVYYLWLVIPFQERLQLSLWDDQKISAFLWPPDPNGREWKPERMRAVLQRESLSGLGQELTVASYRHIAIAISRRHLSSAMSFAPDEDDEDGDGEGDGDDDHPDDVLDAQAAHSSHVSGLFYARGSNDLPGSVVHDRERFRAASQMWHRFLRFESSNIDQRDQKRRRDPFEDEGRQVHFTRWQKLRRLDLETALQEMMGLTAQFRGIQRAAVEAVVRGEGPILAVMATGAGKSLLFLLPSKAADHGVTIVVVPLISLREDMSTRCASLGIRCVEWTARRPADAAQIVLVVPETFVQDEFQSFIRRLQHSHQLDRIVIDECHELLLNDHDFRPAFQQMFILPQIETQLIFLSATLPPLEEGQLCTLMGLKRDELHVFRAPTSRPNLIYSIANLRTSQGNGDEFILNTTSKFHKRYATGKLLIYCHSLDRGAEIAALLHCDFYHSTAVTPALMMKKFITSEQRVLVATDALGLGIDIPDIRVILHIGRPHHIIKFAQQSGRAGRDGNRSRVIIILPFQNTHSVNPGRVSPAVNALNQFLLSRANGACCRRISLDIYLDGRGDRHECEGGEEKCDVCEQKHSESDSVIKNRNQQEESTLMIREKMAFDQQRTQQLSIHRRAKERLQREGSELEMLAEYVSFWQEHCVFCVRQGRLRSRHRWPVCSFMDEDHQRRLKGELAELKAIKFARYAGCWGCGLPQSVCSSWETGDNGGFRRIKKDCVFAHVMAEVLVAVLGESDILTFIQWPETLLAAGCNPADRASVIGFLARRCRWANTEMNELTREFCKIAGVLHEWHVVSMPR